MSRIIDSPRRMVLLLLLVVMFVCTPAWAKREKGKKKKQKKAAAAVAEKKETPAATPATPMPAAPPTPAIVTYPTPAGAIVIPSTPATASPSDKAPAPAAPTSGTAPATRGPLKIELTLSGNLEASSMSEVSIAPKQWSQMVVVEAVPPGTRVTKGQTLLKLDTTKIDEAIREAESSRALADLGLHIVSENYKLAEKGIPLDEEVAERAKKSAEQDYERYVKVESAQAKKSADFALKSSEQNLEYVAEELKQLEKMYKADDLTEETEEIILKRARNDLERNQHFTEQARLRHERTLGLDLPRAADTQSQTLRQALLSYDRARLNIPAGRVRQKLELEKAQADHKKSADKLAELKRDRDLLTITAPAAGVVHYGRSLNGKWATASMTAQKLRPGGQIMPHEILMTIVSEGPWVVRSAVAERDVASLQPGLVGTFKPTAYPRLRIPLKVREVASVLGGDGNFEVTLELTGTAESRLSAGMSGEIKLAVYLNADAITIPTRAIFAEELNEDSKYVYVATAAGKSDKRTVTIGQSKGDMTEIVSGLNAGESVLLQKP
jgi:HlyD family secretion protein